MPSSIQQQLDGVRDSIASLFKRQQRDRVSISNPQNATRVVHVTYDPVSGSFSGVPPDWRHAFAPSVGEPDCSSELDDSGVELSPAGSPDTRPRELLRLTFDNDCGEFVGFPQHWRERLLRNNLLQPEFQKNPQLLATVFAMMDEELRRMDEEGLDVDVAAIDDRQAVAYEIHSHSAVSIDSVSQQPCRSLVTVRAVKLLRN